MYRKILVPLDGSAFAEAALPVALALSRRCGGEIEMITVHEPVPSFAYDEWEAAARTWSENYLADVKERAAQAGVGPLDTAVLSGRVSEAIEAHARSSEADITIMATHGRGAFSRAWLGSVADTFVRHAPCPVLLVRPQEKDPDISRERTLSRMIIPLDGSPLSEAVLPLATELARAFESELLLLRVVAYPLEITSPYLPHTVQMNQEIVDEAKDSARAYLQTRAERLREEGFTVDVEVQVDSQAGHGILDVGEAWKADIIAMATHGRTGMARAILGSATDKVVRGAHGAVLVYRPDPD